MSEEDEKLNTRRIVNQSALMQNIEILKDTNFVSIPTGPFVNGVSLSDEGDLDGTTINKLYNFKNFIQAYNKLTAASLSTLIPLPSLSASFCADSMLSLLNSCFNISLPFRRRASSMIVISELNVHMI